MVENSCVDEIESRYLLFNISLNSTPNQNITEGSDSQNEDADHQGSIDGLPVFDLQCAISADDGVTI
jgi:hypothetical protein